MGGAGQGANDLSFGEIRDLDQPCIRDIDEHSVALDLKALRVRLEPDIANLSLGCGINNRKRAGAIADQDAVALGIDPHIVGVVVQIDLAEGR